MNLRNQPQKPALTYLHLGDHCWRLPANEVCKPRFVLGQIYNACQGILRIQPVHGWVLAILLYVQPAGQTQPPYMV